MILFYFIWHKQIVKTKGDLILRYYKNNEVNLLIILLYNIINIQISINKTKQFKRIYKIFNNKFIYIYIKSLLEYFIRSEIII